MFAYMITNFRNL